MEPAARRRDDAVTGWYVLAWSIKPQWSLPVSGRTTGKFTSDPLIATELQWSPSLSDGTASHRYLLAADIDVAAM